MNGREQLKVLVVDSQRDTRASLVAGLEREGFVVAQSATAEDTRSRLEGFAYDGLVIEVRLPDGDGLEILDEALSRYPNLRAIVTDRFGSIHHAVKALKRGALDYLTTPVNSAKVAGALGKAMVDRSPVQPPARQTQPVAGSVPATPPRSSRVEASQPSTPFVLSGIVGESPSMERLYSILERISPLQSTVLIQGETGTGKELVARTIHQNSPRREQAFVAFNAAAIPEGLAEAELFGHSKGAFTGAVQARAGRFELADQGTLFIDEVSSMSLSLQAKLLRALQEREIERIGTSRSMRINTRVIAASNIDLKDMVKAGTFREDLFYRLNVLAVSLPPLRDRREDITALASHFVKASCELNGLPIKTFSQATLRALMNYEWPGNVRHLQNAVDYAVAMSGPDVVIEPETLPEEVLEAGRTLRLVENTPVPLPEMPDEGINFADTMTGIERALILRYLEQSGGNKRQAARLLNLSRTTLIDKLHRLGVTEPASALPEEAQAIA